MASIKNTIYLPNYERFQITHLLRSYSSHPTPNQIPQILKTLDHFGLLQIQYTRTPIISFMSEIIKKNPKIISQWANKINHNSTWQTQALYQSIWNSNTKEGKSYLNHLKRIDHKNAEVLLQSIMAKPPIDILQVNLTPDLLDQLWGAFFATGHSKFIRKIANGLNAIELKKSSDFKNAMSDIAYNLGILTVSNNEKVFETTGWSLASNLYQNPKLFTIYQDIAHHSPAQEKKLLFIIIKNVKQRITHNKRLIQKLQAQSKNNKKTRELAYFYFKQNNQKKYIYWIKKSAKQGNADSQSNLGLYYTRGWFGIKQNFDQANFWLKKAARSNNASALQQLGQNYFHGYGLKKDHKKAFFYFGQAAAQKNICGLYMVGKFYTQGISVKKDFSLAKQWLFLAAKEFYWQSIDRGIPPNNTREIIKTFPNYYIWLSNQPTTESKTFYANQSTINHLQLLTKYFNYACN